MKSRLQLLMVAVSLTAFVAACSGSPAPVTATATPVPAVDCTQGEHHPIAQSIADDFGVSYDQVMAWACAGETFDDILLALQTSEMVQRPADELLAMKKRAGDWDKVWESLGLAGQPARGQ